MLRWQLYFKHKREREWQEKTPEFYYLAQIAQELRRIYHAVCGQGGLTKRYQDKIDDAVKSLKPFMFEFQLGSKNKEEKKVDLERMDKLSEVSKLYLRTRVTNLRGTGKTLAVAQAPAVYRDDLKWR